MANSRFFGIKLDKLEFGVKVPKNKNKDLEKANPFKNKKKKKSRKSKGR